ELAVVFTQRARRRAETRIGRIGTARPLPDHTESVVDEVQARRNFPSRFGRQVLAGPAREGVGLVVADMGDRRGRIDGLETCERELEPAAIDLAPIAGRTPAFGLDRGKTVRKPER